MEIRQAKIAERLVIAGFQIAMAAETENLELDKATVGKGVTSVFEDQSKGRYFVAESNGKVIGSLLVTYEWSDWRNGNIWWIQSVYIKPEYRRKGVYTKMYQHIKSIVENDESLQGIRLYVEKTNTVAQAVYKNLGMNGNHYSTFEWMKNF